MYDRRLSGLGRPRNFVSHSRCARADAGANPDKGGSPRGVAAMSMIARAAAAIERLGKRMRTPGKSRKSGRGNLAWAGAPANRRRIGGPVASSTGEAAAIDALAACL